VSQFADAPDEDLLGSVRTPYELPDRSVHRTGMRTHRIVFGVAAFPR
jgi:hypothetical protein